MRVRLKGFRAWGLGFRGLGFRGSSRLRRRRRSGR